MTNTELNQITAAGVATGAAALILTACGAIVPALILMTGPMFAAAIVHESETANQ
jgi:hypothetical protein